MKCDICFSDDFLSNVCHAFKDEIDKDKDLYFCNPNWMYYDKNRHFTRLRRVTNPELNLWLFWRRVSVIN